MGFTNKKRAEVLVMLAKAAKLCGQCELVGWDRWLWEVIKHKVGNYEGPDCREMLQAINQNGLPQSVETYETMLCNELSTYIDIMPLDKTRIKKQAPPFELLNDIVLAHAKPIAELVSHILDRKKKLSESEDEYAHCFEAGVPLEYLHTLIRAYHNKSLLLGFLLGKDGVGGLDAMFAEPEKYCARDEEYEQLGEKYRALLDHYTDYSQEEIDRVTNHYGRTCLGYSPEPKNIPRSKQQKVEE